MTGRTYSALGIVLKSRNIGEADKILTVYTKHQGKIRIVAKGVRKISSRKAGIIDSFSLLKMFLARGRSLDILAEAQSVERFPLWRKDLDKVSVVYYLGELVDKLTPDNQPDEGTFDLLLEFLYKIEKTNEKSLLSGMVVEFEKRLLTIAGFGIPPQIGDKQEGIDQYIEEITGKPIKSRKILRKDD